MSHAQSLTQGISLNSLSSSLLSSATTILNQPQQHQVQSMQTQNQLQHTAMLQTTTSQHQNHINVPLTTNNTSMIQTTSANDVHQTTNISNNVNGTNDLTNSNGLVANHTTTVPSAPATISNTNKNKKKKKKPPKEKKPRPKPG